MTTNAVADWGVRLSDRIRALIVAEDFAAARGLVLKGEGFTRNLAAEYTFMYRGLGVAVRALLDLLSRYEDAGGEVAALVQSLRPSSDATVGRLDREIEMALLALERGEVDFEKGQARMADEIVACIEARDGQRALALLDEKELVHYVPAHDSLLRFMAKSFGWVLQRQGRAELLRLHRAMAEAMRPGFDRWDRLSAEEFARTTVFLLKQHMGNVHVVEDEEKFTIRQTPCGSGGRMQLEGAYSGEGALPYVEGAGPLTFGEPRLPVYCSHCAIWNGAAPLAWYGRPHWVFEKPARPDGSCTMHIYKRRDGAPLEYAARVRFPSED